MRHHEPSERTNQAPSRRGHPDATDRRPGQEAAGPDAPRGQVRSGYGRLVPGPAGGTAARPPEDRTTVAPTPRGPAAPGEADRRRPAPPAARKPSVPAPRPELPDRPTVAPTPAPGRNEDGPQHARPVVPRQASPAQPPAHQVPPVPPVPPVLPQGPAPTGHTRHTPQRPGQDAHGTGADAEGIPDLLGAEAEAEFRRRWHEVQGRFVDDPRQALHAADVLVGDVMRNLADTFARHRNSLDSQWSQGREADTESLRRALCQYRALFHRLLST
ncbi:hypothetical protein [Streptomyces hydrogenans]|uniref:hypothetical protein n=1 Tax=Streptomyces hydrogenans TaxID=1873719 RepID=UPI003423DED8